MMTDSEISHVFPDHSADGAVDSVVRSCHDALCAALLNTSAERLEIQLIFIPRVNRRVLPAAADLGVVSIEVSHGLMHSADIFGSSPCIPSM